MTWNETAMVVQQLAQAYLAEVEAFAETLRPRFEAGELRGWWNGDGDRLGFAQEAGSDWIPPLWRLEHLCARRFGLKGKIAHLALAVAGGRFDEGGGPDQQAREAVAQDVLAVARRRGYVKRRAPRAPPQATGRSAPGIRVLR